MSTIVSNNIQIGQSGTTTNNFTLYQPTVADGTVRLANGIAGSTTDLVTITSAGNVGIGLSNPTNSLSIYNATSAIISVYGDSHAQINTRRYSTDADGPITQLRKYRGTYQSPTIVSSGDITGRFLFFGYDGSASRATAEIRSEVDGEPGVSDMPGRLIFFTTPDGSGFGVERMRIDSTGNLLVGTTSAAVPSTTGYISTANTFGFKNRIINGAMMIDQRNAGASVSASAGAIVYTVDRWALYSTGAGSTAQQVAGPNTTDKALQVVPTGGNIVQIILQRIESKNCVDLAGQTVTVSGKIYIDNATGAACNVKVVTATSTDTNYVTDQGSFAVSLVSGLYVSFSGQINLTAAAANGIQLEFYFAGVASKTIKVTGVQLEKGSTATSFDYRPYGTELALCQRYYYRLKATAAGQACGVGYNNSTTITNFTTWFPVEMRTPPSALEQSGTASNYLVRHNQAEITCSAVPTFVSASYICSEYSFTVASGLTGGQGSLGRFNSTSGYLAWSAEL